MDFYRKVAKFFIFSCEFNSHYDPVMQLLILPGGKKRLLYLQAICLDYSGCFPSTKYSVQSGQV